MESMNIVLPTWLGIVIGVVYVIERLHKIGLFKWLSRKVKQLYAKCYLFFVCKNNPIIAKNKKEEKKAFWHLQAMTGITKAKHRRIAKIREKMMGKIEENNNKRNKGEKNNEQQK